MSHSLEYECDVPFKECPRSKGSIPLWIAVARARDRYVHDRTTINRKIYQDAVDKYAHYFSQEPIKIV